MMEDPTDEKNLNFIQPEKKLKRSELKIFLTDGFAAFLRAVTVNNNPYYAHY